MDRWLHIPLLRHGRPYRSLDVARVPHYRTREPFVEISQANVGSDPPRSARSGRRARRTGRVFLVRTVYGFARAAAELFLSRRLPLGESAQSPDDYVRQVSATTGLPHVMVRRNMHKIHKMMAEMGAVFNGLTRNLDLARARSRLRPDGGQELSFFPRGNSLGVVLPSNSPGVHSLWIPAFALKMPLVLKPGGAEPWTPYRIIQALIRAGAPPEVFGYYPADHAGGAEILRRCGPRHGLRRCVFHETLAGRSAYRSAWPRLQQDRHRRGCRRRLGEVPGRDGCLDRGKLRPVLHQRIGCVGAGALRTRSPRRWPSGWRAWLPRDADDPEAQLAPFADAGVAERISEMIDSQLDGARRRERAEARDRPAGHPSRLLLPACRPSSIALSPEHPLANREFLFPFASVVPVSEAEIPRALGPSLVVTAITQDRKLIGRLLASPLVGRLNLGAIPTNHIQWDQPHEGNLFDHLYARRAFQRAEARCLMKILAFTAGAANMYCGSCLRDNALAAELMATGTTSSWFRFIRRP